jgi:hypothetical protein
MLEFLALFTIAGIGLFILAVIFVIGFVLKLTFKVLLLPLALLGGVFKILGLLLLVLVGIVLAPVLFGFVFLLALPVLLVLGLFGLGWAVVTA